MRLSASIFLSILVHSGTDACDTDTWVNCKKYKQCVKTQEGESFQRTVFCTQGNVPARNGDNISCVGKASLSCSAECADPCEDEEAKPAPSSPGQCIENSVSAISCTKYHLCIGGIQRTVHCNAGLVHDGVSTECAEVSSLPVGHDCGPPTPTTAPGGCDESSVEAVSCTTYRMCIGGIKRLVHCNAGLVHDGVSTGCVPSDALPAGASCGPQGCVPGTVEAATCTTFRLCARGSMHLVHCNAGLVHDGVSAKCVLPSELPCNSQCGLECVNTCSAGHVVPIDCNHFRVCVDGVYKLSRCNEGLVHVGPEAVCIPQSALPCGTACAAACPSVTAVSECVDGSASPVSCKKFKFCVDGQWKMSYCKQGLVHAGGYEAICVARSSLECGSNCAPECPPTCEDGSFIPLDCTHFRYCYNGEWKTSHCHEGLVNLGDEARCVAQDELECGTQCALECFTSVTDCEPGQVDDSSCGGYAVCDQEGHWHGTACQEGTVHVAGAGCIDQSIIDCSHECGPECAAPVACEVCPISECPECPLLIEYKCPCDEIHGKMELLKQDIKGIFESQMDQMSCDA